MSIDLVNSRILVTGATGFLGRHLTSLLKNMGCQNVTAVGGWSRDSYQNSVAYNLAISHEVDNLFYKRGPFDYVFHLAGYNGGIQFNKDFPADIFTLNTVMGLNLLGACRWNKVKKVVSVVASCAYPMEEYQDNGCGKYGFEPREVMVEDDFLDGPPHPSVACHGYAKRNLQLASSFYRQQSGLVGVCACPTTLYGPGDSYDPERTKLMGALVKKFVDAAETSAPEVVVWGSGKPKREFLYVEDCANLLVETMLRYEDSNVPLNLGTGQELSVAELAELIKRCVPFTGNIKFDTSRPDGQYRKRLDLTRMEKSIPGFVPTPLEVGLMATIGDYRKTWYNTPEAKV